MASCTTALLITAAMAVVVGGGALLPATASAETYVVGDGYEDRDGYGWALGVDYNKWASDQTLYVGDILKLRYETDQPFPHNVVQVDQANFQACTANTPPLTSGVDTVVLNYPGQNYFISSLQSDCQAGMKLNVNVAQQPAG